MMGEKSKDINVVRKMFRGENEKVKKQTKAICDLSTEHSTFENNQTNSPPKT